MQMNWLKLKIRDWLNSAQDICIREEIVYSKHANRGLAVTADGETLSTEPLRLSVYRANGGTIVETRIYDRQKDRSTNQLHIVGHDQDLGQSLSKIITMESLRG
jgi:hypothetical protein